MATCPKCGTALKIWQMSPYCKKCGVHIMFASFEGQFEKDRRISEMSMAFFRYNMVKLKTAYVGGLAQKLRIAFALIPLFTVLLPLGSLSIVTPFYNSSVTYNIFDLVVSGIFGGLFVKLGVFEQGPVFGAVAGALQPLMIAYLAMAFFAALVLLTGVLGFIGNKKTSVLMSVFSVLGMCASVVVKVLAMRVDAAAEAAGSLVNADSNALFLVAVLLFVPPLIASILCLKNPPVRVFREGDELRVDYRRKWKKGEIDLLSIPAPIYESAEDRAEKRKLISEAYQVEEVTENG